MISLGYKIMEVKNGKFFTLFHGVNGSKELKPYTWIEAIQKEVSDGGTKYISGFHIFRDYDETIKYAKRFKIKENRFIVLVNYSGDRMKDHSPAEVVLADKIKILNVLEPI